MKVSLTTTTTSCIQNIRHTNIKTDAKIIITQVSHPNQLFASLLPRSASNSCPLPPPFLKLSLHSCIVYFNRISVTCTNVSISYTDSMKQVETEENPVSEFIWGRLNNSESIIECPLIMGHAETESCVYICKTFGPI